MTVENYQVLLQVTILNLPRILSQCGDMDKMLCLVRLQTSIDPTNPNNFVNLREMRHLIHGSSFTIRFEHTYRLQNGMELKPGINIIMKQILTLLPGIWINILMMKVDVLVKITSANHLRITPIRDQHEMFDYFITLDSKDNWYLQWASYNAKSEIVPWYIGVEAGIPRGAYSAPCKILRFGYYW